MAAPWRARRRVDGRRFTPRCVLVVVVVAARRGLLPLSLAARQHTLASRRGTRTHAEAVCKAALVEPPPRRVRLLERRCTKAVSLSKMLKPSFKPANSASRRLLRSS